jgi:hypothetical protein
MVHEVEGWMVVGSSHDEVIKFLKLRNPSSRTMTHLFTHPLTEMSKGRPERKADNLTATCVPIV